LSAPNTQAVTTDTPATSTNGMTTKVVKGSFWFFLGQVLPMLATFVASPFVIRYLGTEAYGILLIVAMVTMNFAYADIGMNLASTKFGAEAYANNNAEEEGVIIRTAALIAFIPTFLVGALIFIFADNIMTGFFQIKSQYREAANIGLKLGSVAFVFSSLGNVMNTPQFSRLKINLNVLANAVPRIIMIVATPIVLKAGYGIAGACMVAFLAAVVIFLLNVGISGKLLPQLYRLSIDRKKIRPLLVFGKGVVIFGLALMIIGNMEKIILARLLNSKASAYYSIAFTLANMALMFTVGMMQTLNSAFSQLLQPDKQEELKILFLRCVRLNAILLIPSILTMVAIAKPFFTIWAGAEFGEKSVFPFYVLLIGIVCHIMALVPSGILVVAGKATSFVKLYYIEIIPYGILIYFLINKFGIIGAAMAWSFKEVITAIGLVYFTKKHFNLTLGLSKFSKGILMGILTFMPLIAFALLYDNFSPLLVFIIPITFLFYFLIVWKNLLEEPERSWLINKTQKGSYINKLLLALQH
jgi:O-antigen/teichoic acid export membrane protein